MEEISTQAAVLPPVLNLSEKDESDIICILLPTSPAAHEAVELTARATPQHILQNHGVSHISEAPDDDMTTGRDTHTGDNSEGSGNLDTELSDPNQSKWDGPTKDIALRFSSKVHNLAMGFIFGRNHQKSDLLLGDNGACSNCHFRIYMKNNGSLMIADISSNGIVVDDVVLKGARAKGSEPAHQDRCTIMNCSTIELPLNEPRKGQSIRFSVKMPGRSELGQDKYNRNCIAYIKCVEQAERQYGFLAEVKLRENPPAVLPVSHRASCHLSLLFFLT